MWSSGYIGGAIGLRSAEPFTMTFFRFVLGASILLLITFITRAPWPSWSRAVHIIVVGVFIQAMQFGGLYSGMRAGVPAGESALIVGMMPILVALGAGVWLNEKLSWRQWSGLLLGLVGVTLVLWNRLGHGSASLTAYLLTGCALLGITIGTLYQKKFCAGMDLRTGGFIQLVVGAVVMFILASRTETMVVQWNTTFVLSVAWLAVVNSIGAISLLYIMIRRGEASKTASLFYLIPPVTAIMASLMLGEFPTLLAMLGFAASATGVYLATKPTPAPAPIQQQPRESAPLTAVNAVSTEGVK
jgi:drug/metabolite transporter (DMT)-like permease